MDKDSSESRDRGTLLHVIKRKPNAQVSSLKEFMEFDFRPSNHLIAIGPKLDGKTLHIKASSLEWTVILIKLAHVFYKVHSTIVNNERRSMESLRKFHPLYLMREM